MKKPTNAQMRILQKINAACGKVRGYVEVELQGGEWRSHRSCKRRGWLTAGILTSVPGGLFVCWMYALTDAGFDALDGKSVTS